MSGLLPIPRWRLAAVATAAVLAIVPLPADDVEAFYAQGVYPWIQAALTWTSNLLPFALFDLLLVTVVTAWLALLVRDSRRHRWTTAIVRLSTRTAVLAAVLYLAFLLARGFNYRRVALEDRLQLSYKAVTPAAAERLARLAVAEVNRLAAGAPAASAPLVANGSLPAALARVQAQLGAPRAIVPGRPKHTLLDPYFRAAAVDGMTDPFFLETMVLSTLLPFERPIVTAHEWAHLAGYADEGEANFVGWLACLHGDEAARYSAWLFLFSESLPALDGDGRRAVLAQLAAQPRADLQAIAARVSADVNRFVSAVGWGLYDQYLKANGVERGRRSYTDVVQLVLGTDLGAEALASVAASLASAGITVPAAPALPRPPAR